MVAVIGRPTRGSRASASTGWAGCRTRIRRTSSAACSYRPKLGMM